MGSEGYRGRAFAGKIFPARAGARRIEAGIIDLTH